MSQARLFKEAIPLTGIVLAKLDGTAKGGIAIAIQRELGIPIKWLGIGKAWMTWKTLNRRLLWLHS